MLKLEGVFLVHPSIRRERKAQIDRRKRSSDRSREQGVRGFALFLQKVAMTYPAMLVVKGGRGSRKTLHLLLLLVVLVLFRLVE